MGKNHLSHGTDGGLAVFRERTDVFVHIFGAGKLVNIGKKNLLYNRMAGGKLKPIYDGF
jgi:hypothetical protein